MGEKAFTIAWMRGSQLFAPLPDALLNELAGHCSIQSFSAGDFLIRENGDNISLFLLTRGEVKIVSNGTEVDRQQSGDTVGEISSSGISPPVADVIAIDDVEAVSFPLELIQSLCNTHPDFARRLREAGMIKVYGR
ncbi:Cyclic nucleotide-binding domain-containing protein [Mariprofundus ferrinatatus]|uniref:Cyclic nucleotide-binding domain-containing protein n=1 Tax=Mariprofundus ferrinatatus TaxID=1921087 RepID=A0A2K8L8I3_9PROT|nr:cyclic nucleotide-binding domain-containing protein [Mariprofundus ferrinatatus]ATX82181.1 Cyclic nucleotide-binding domain-containing protein [Mariprofundus ferrinatatus]